MQISSDYAQGFVQDTVYETSVSATTTKLVRSAQLLTRPEIRRLCVVFWHQC